MNWNQHPCNYSQLQQQIKALKSVEATTTDTKASTDFSSIATSTKRKSTSTLPLPSSKKQKQAVAEEESSSADIIFNNSISLPSYPEIQKLYQALLLSKYQHIHPDLLKAPRTREDVHGGVATPTTGNNLNSTTTTSSTIVQEGTTAVNTATQDLQALAAQYNAHIAEGDIEVILEDLLNLSKQKYNSELKLEYGQLKDFDLIQIFQKVFLNATNVPYNTGLNMIKYALYVKIKNLNDIPGIQLISICDIIGKYNKKLLIHGILSPLLSEEHFEKFQAQLIVKIFREIKFTTEEYTMLLKNLATEKYQHINMNQTRSLAEDMSLVTLNDHHLTVFQAILNQKISMTNDMLREIISVYNLFNVADIKKSKSHGMFLFSLCRACLKIKISNESYQELIRLSDINETFLRKKVKDLLKKFNM